MIFRRRRKRWSNADVASALAVIDSYPPGELVWFAHSPEEEADARARFEPRGFRVVPVYPKR